MPSQPTLHRAQLVTEHLTAAGREQTTSDVADALGWTLSTTSRALRTAAELGLIRQVRHGWWAPLAAGAPSPAPQRMAGWLASCGPDWWSLGELVAATGYAERTARHQVLQALRRGDIEADPDQNLWRRRGASGA